jgi:hypothetical protein
MNEIVSLCNLQVFIFGLLRYSQQNGLSYLDTRDQLLAVKSSWHHQLCFHKICISNWKSSYQSAEAVKLNECTYL